MCILPFPVEFPELPSGRRRIYLVILCGEAEFPFVDAVNYIRITFRLIEIRTYPNIISDSIR